MQCPRDQASLVHFEDPRGMLMMRCFFCEGAFLSAPQLRRLHHLKAAFQGEDPDLDLPESSRPTCPGCQGEMRSRWFSQARRILLDQCRACGGVWLDTDELKKILGEIYGLD